MSTEQIADTFNAAHAEFREMSGWLWDPLAADLVAAAGPRPGDRVLDACCGAGSSALPGLVGIRTRPARHRPRLTDETAWRFARGSGLRRVLDQVGPGGEQRVREGYLGRLRARGVTELNASALIGIGTRPGG